MSALFPVWSNTAFRVLLCGLLLGVIVLIGGPMLYVRSPLYTTEDNMVAQPIQFDHRHHVQDDRIDCRYCHTYVERSPYAGVPPTTLCMNCHAQIWNDSPMLAPVRASALTGRPVIWNRVHNLPDFVYFNHAIHVNKGVGCVTCHGRVDEMPVVYQDKPLTMGWCLECHRDPAPHLRPREAITSMTWQAPGDPRALGAELMRKYDVLTRTSCTTCHR